MTCKCMLLALPVILTGLTHPAGARYYPALASGQTAPWTARQGERI